MATLSQDIEAYQTMLPDIRSKHGSVWALVINCKLISTFKEFSEAARYVAAHQIQDDVLIRHTDERTESAPFIQINN